MSLGSAAAQGGDTPSPKKQEAAEVKACAEMAFTGFRPIADTREQRFQGKVTELTALCRGGTKAVQVPDDAMGRLDELLGHGRPVVAAEGLSVDVGAAVSRRVGSAARPGVPAHRADQVQPVRQQRDLPGLRCGPQWAGGRGAQDVAGDAAAAERSELRCGRRRRRAGLQRGVDSRAHADGNLQRHSQSADGLDRHAVCAQRGVRNDVSGPGAERSSPRTGMAAGSVC